MKLTFKEYGEYYAYRTHNIDTDELREYLEENFEGLNVQSLSDDRIKEILYDPNLEETIVYDKKANKNYYLDEIVSAWVSDHLYEDDYEWKFYETHIIGDELVELGE